MYNDEKKVPQLLNPITGAYEYAQGINGGLKIASYDDKDDMVKIKSMQKKWRDSFGGTSLDASKWDIISQGTGQTIGVASGVLTMGAGTTINATTIIRTKEVFTIPFRAMCGFSLSQRIANQTFYIELISVDANGNADGKYSAGWKLDGTTATTGIYEVMNGSTVLSSSASTINTTASANILEVEAFADECWFHARQLDSTSGRTNSYVRHQQIPDPNALYKVQIRIVNGASAPASNTNFVCQYIVVNDYAELTAEITAGRGNAVAGQGLFSTVTGSVSISGTSSANISQYGGTAVVNGGTAGLIGIGGSVAHDGVASGNPVRIGGRAMTANYTGVASGDVADVVTTVVGAVVNKPYSIPEADWSYAGTAVTTTTDVALKSAGATGIRNYVTSFQYQNTGTVATEIVIKDGATVIWRGYASASMTVPAIVTLNTPLKGTAVTAMNFACITTGANVYVNAQGYQAP